MDAGLPEPEINGEVHDVQRQDRLAPLGWRNIRVTKLQMRTNPHGVIGRIVQAVADASVVS